MNYSKINNINNSRTNLIINNFIKNVNLIAEKKMLCFQ